MLRAAVGVHGTRTARDLRRPGHRAPGTRARGERALSFRLDCMRGHERYTHIHPRFPLAATGGCVATVSLVCHLRVAMAFGVRLAESVVLCAAPR